MIKFLSIAVGLHLSVALVVLAARAGRDVGPKAPAELSADTRQDGSILSGGTFKERRGSKASARSATSSTTSASTSAAAGADQPAAAAPPAQSPVTRSRETGSREPRREDPSGETSDPKSTTAPAPSDDPEDEDGPARPAPAAAAAATPTGADKAKPGTLSDATGDTVIDGSERRAREARADIVGARAAYEPGGLTLTLQVKEPIDPRTDERWASDSTYVTWEVDTNGDATPDFEVQYFRLDQDNLGGSVSRPGDDGEAVCDGTVATYSADSYTVTIDPACLGAPASLSYRASIFYDTNPADENADVVTDVTPNGGMSFPVNRP